MDEFTDSEIKSTPTTEPAPEPAAESETTKPGHSTGPRTPAGKAKSSMNRLKHGCRSEKAVLRDEDPAEYEANMQAWIDTYNPQDSKEDELVHELALAHWHLKRARKRLEEIEFNLPGNAWNWTEEHQQLFANFTRYKTTAERSFLRWYKEIEAHRGRQFREDQIREKARIAAAAVEVKWLTDKEIETNKALRVIQVVEVEVERGKCTTSCYPSNREITDFFANRQTPPIFVKRVIVFPDGVPPEYAWTDPKPVEKSKEPQAVQNMLWRRWLNVIDREEALGTGHIGPMF